MFRATQEAGIQYVDARSAGNINSSEFKKKVTNQLQADLREDSGFISDVQAENAKLRAQISQPAGTTKRAKGKNSGGGISGSGDTVPALLTPGEFVVNKKSAQSIGYGNLARMNRDGVSRFNKGGAVGPKKFFAGGLVGGVAGGGGNLLVLATAAQTAVSVFQSLTEKVEDVNKPLSKTKLFFDGLAAVGIQIGAIALAVKFGKEKLLNGLLALNHLRML